MSGIWRMLDASLNRGREAARVIEDLARFTVDDAALSAQGKSLRHGIGLLEQSIAAQEGGAAARRASRDTANDVGRENEGALEGARGDASGLAAANFRRLAEALRSVEECLKVLQETRPELWQSAKRLRYDTYILQSAMEQAFTRGTGRQWSICLLLMRAHCTLPWQQTLVESIGAGVDCIQVREKEMTTAELLRHIREVRQLAGPVPVIVNDRLDLALAAEASGVHLGQADLPVSAARRLAREGFLIGATCHSMAEAAAAVADGADYCGVGPMFATAIKPSLPLAGPPLLRQFIQEHSAVPHLAIGGINPGNIEALAAVGCRGVAVSTALCAAREPGEVVGALRAALHAAVA